mmetsp:Transcript_8497/g.14082  ORF Transcript_8497/g.14082 Transcript_8497/m.14082 type:complete len:275 (-) Transcript_8497:547-1371(-)|eukprot:CAMPEP_0119005486 /NCGR_PEP_ID=MMETSP1176-20130426/1743_1 /TAXON_ID=265551 /ORGANISM="Synedropsis recta cf, Strain CCMP1620" /LENGTH=274 /DNA_ID=CAMNT_0006957299 /DNA_START=79 /DNA_END=903 /DNA_ORIENTATION=-
MTASPNTMTAVLVMAWLLLPSSAFVSSRLHHSRDNQQLLAGKTLTLPIFPLRKAVRVPTETLTLNLYEERYLAMSEYILSQETQLFGTLYCSDKPQIVHGGQGAIVPMVEVGDIGAIFNVFQHEEGMVPTATEGYSRRRIRLQALGTSRFQIVKILHPGYNTKFPFILAEVEPVEDVEDNIDDLKEKLERIGVPILSKSKEGEPATPERFNDDEPTCDDPQHFSFSVVSALSEKLTPQEIMSLLRMTSTRMRLESLIQVLDPEPLSFQRLFGLR